MNEKDQIIAIAEELGWSHIADKSNPLMMPEGTYLRGFHPKTCLIGMRQDLPRYTTDANAALEFAQHLGELGWRCLLDSRFDGKWNASFSKNGNVFATADTVAAVICEAGLRALEKWQP